MNTARRVTALPTEPYLKQVARWPASGRHILAHYDETAIVVYQAYRASIAEHALEHGVFGGPEFSFSRMSWIKPNFLWMMYRSSWGTAEGQEALLGIRISRTFFDLLVESAVASSHEPDSGQSQAEWQDSLRSSNVRLQWDPDHDPAGRPLERRAIQLGLRGDVLRAFATSEIIELLDLRAFVAAQRPLAQQAGWQHLQTPIERVYE